MTNVSLKEHMQFLERFQNCILKSTLIDDQDTEMRSNPEIYSNVCLYILNMFNRFSLQEIIMAKNVRALIQEARINIPLILSQDMIPVWDKKNLTYTFTVRG